MSAGGECVGDAIVLAGATGRVGAATLRALVREGAHVIVLSRDESRAAATIAAVLTPDLRVRAIAMRADLTVVNDAERVVAEAVARFGRLDAVVNLAGSPAGRIALPESSMDDLAQVVRAFLEPAYTLAVAALRAMLRQSYRDGARAAGS